MIQRNIDAIADVIWFLKGLRQASDPASFPISEYHIDCLSDARAELMDTNEKILMNTKKEEIGA